MKPITVINFFTVKAGKLEEFIQIQNTFAKELCKSFSGLQGGRMYRGLDGKSAVLVSIFESQEAQEEVRKLQIFRDHVGKLQSVLEDAQPALYEVAYTTGNFN